MNVLLKDLLQKVTEFQAEVNRVVSDDLLDLEQLEKLMDTGIELDIDMPELNRLKQVCIDFKSRKLVLSISQ